MKGKCLVYLPYRLEEPPRGARMIRPVKMIRAFEDIGYEVTAVTGLSGERRKQIRTVRERIRRGDEFDFLYAEASTEPTLLTDPGHLPTHPFLDYGFFRFMKAHGVSIGLFYSDLFWKYDGYGAGLPEWKKRCALACYRYDIRQYEKLLNRFYVPDTETFSEVIGSERLTGIMTELCPGAENLDVPDTGIRNFSERPLTVFYVGGLGGNYQIAELLKAVKKTEGTRLILCCRETEWEKEKAELEPFLCDRIQVIHKGGNELAPYYGEADLGSLLFRRGSYIDMAKPFKAYEYLAHELPVLSTTGTEIGRFTGENGTGWNIEYHAEEIAAVLKEILANPEMLQEKRRNCAETKKRNLWTTRAEQVERDLRQ